MRTHQLWEVEADETVRVERAGPGLVLRSDGGTFLVTQAGDLDDHVLGPGDELRVARRGLLVAWALTPGRLAARVEAPRPRWSGRLLPRAA